MSALLSSAICRLTHRLIIPALVGTVLGVPVLAQPPIIQPGPPGQPSRLISVEEASNLASIQYTEADVKLMQGMISHHAQAMEMTALVEARSSREAVRLLAQRIALSQEDEMAMMRDWLTERNQTVPAVDAHHAHDAELMPGMIKPEEMASLEAATGAAFDNLFLTYMIRHHSGAVKWWRPCWSNRALPRIQCYSPSPPMSPPTRPLRSSAWTPCSPDSHRTRA